MYYNGFMNPIIGHPSTPPLGMFAMLFQPASPGTSVIGAGKGTTLCRIETTRELAGTVLHAVGIGTSPKQEAMMWLADGIFTSPYRPSRRDASCMADGIGTSPDHERS